METVWSELEREAGPVLKHLDVLGGPSELE